MRLGFGESEVEGRGRDFVKLENDDRGEIVEEARNLRDTRITLVF